MTDSTKRHDSRSDFIMDFLNHLFVEKNYSRHTVKNYETDLDQFVSFLSSNQEANLLLADREILRGFLKNLHDRGYKATTIRRKFAALSSFYGFLVKRDILEHNPCLEILLPRMEKNVPSFITAEDMAFFLDSMKVENWMDARNKAMFELMYSTGVRVSELVSMDISDIDFQGFVKVLGKGNKERLLPFGGKAMASLNLYLEMLKYENIHIEEAFFLNRFKKRISTRSVQRILNRLFIKAGLFFKVSPHMIRHSFATHILDGGANLRVVQEFLNHSSLSTTQKYTHVTMDRLMRVYDDSHPRK